MKVAFDENMPAAMVRILRGFHAERGLRTLVAGISIVRAQDYYPGKTDADFGLKDDSPWIRRFAADGGRVVVSGDTRMMKKPHERLALIEAGLTTIFFPNPWHGWKFCQKCALLMHWWPTIIATVKKPEPGFFMVQKSWPDYGEAKLRTLPIGDLNMTKVARQLAERDVVRAARLRKRDERAAKGDLLNEKPET